MRGMSNNSNIFMILLNKRVIFLINFDWMSLANKQLVDTQLVPRPHRLQTISVARRE